MPALSKLRRRGIAPILAHDMESAAVDSPLGAAAEPAAPAQSQDRKLFVLLLVLLALLYATCYTPMWNPGGSDDAFYLTIARNLARGQGFTWHGSPVIISPPGWPAFLAGVMRYVSPSFAVLNLLLIGLMLSAAGMWYWILRRFMTGRQSFWVTLLSGTLFQWLRCTMHHYSEAPFCFILALTILLALQSAEGRWLWWRAPVLVLASAALVMVRWQGILIAPVVVGAAMAGQSLRPRFNRQWIMASLVALAMAGTFYPTWRILHGIADKAGADEVLAQDDRRAEKMLGESPRGFAGRLIDTGSWMTNLVWPQADMVKMGRGMDLFEDAVGWVFVALFGLAACAAARRRQWVWLGMLVHLVVLAVMWAKPNGRYIAPAAPLLLAGVWLTARRLATGGQRSGGACRVGVPAHHPPAMAGEYAHPTFEPHLARTLAHPGSDGASPSRLRHVGSIGLALFIASLIASNGPAIAISAYVARSPRPYATSLGGEYESFLQIARYLDEHGAKDDEVAIGAGTYEASSLRNARFTRRMLTWMADRLLQAVPTDACYDRPDAELAKWMMLQPYKPKPPVYRPGSRWANRSATRPGAAKKPSTKAPKPPPPRPQVVVKYYIARVMPQPKPMWHFRRSELPKWLGGTNEPDPAFLELWELKDGQFTRIELPPVSEGIRRVPGM